MATRSDVHEFIIACIIACEADGFEGFDYDKESPILTPDAWAHDGERCVTLRYGGEEFLVTVSKPRK